MLIWAITMLMVTTRVGTESSNQTCSLVVDSISEFKPCNTSAKHCNCSVDAATCRGTKNFYLTFIPNLQINLTGLDFSGNRLENLTGKTFANIIDKPVANLSLCHCHIRSIAPDAFRGLNHLQVLDLSHNKISISVFIEAFSSLSSLPLITLYLAEMGWTTISSTFWNKLEKMTALQHLFLNSNRVTTLNITNLGNITELDLSGNKELTTIHVSRTMPALRNLSLNACGLSSWPSFCPTNKPTNLPNLQYLSLSGNCIKTIKSAHLPCLKLLEEINFSHNPIKVLSKNLFAGNPKLKRVRANSLKGSRQVIRKHAFNSTSIEYINLSNNDLEENQINPKLFRSCVQVTYLDLSGNRFGSSASRNGSIIKMRYINALLGPLIHLTTLNLSFNYLRYVPFVIHNMTDLEYLNLNENRIHCITTDSARGLHNLTHLKELNLSSNSLSSIPEAAFPEDFRRHLTGIDLTFNQLTCDCNLLWLIEWFRLNYTRFYGHPDDYWCGTPTDTSFDKTSLSQQYCLMSEANKMLIISMISVILAVMIIYPLIYRYRWHLQYFIFMLRYDALRVGRDKHVDYQYDAFLSYNADDHAWVVQELLPALEERKGIRLCVHERDFQAGKLIVDNIVDNMFASRKVIVLMSMNYAKSEWCQFELTLSQKMVFERGRDLMVVVMLSEIPRDQVTKTMYAVLKTTTYLTWSADQGASVAFWERLADAVQEQSGGLSETGRMILADV